jgi:hypothetical protein
MSASGARRSRRADYQRTQLLSSRAHCFRLVDTGCVAPPEAKREYNTSHGLEWRWRRPVVESESVKTYVGSALDVTEQELLRQELRRSESYQAEAQRLSHTGNWGWKPDGGEVVWSEFHGSGRWGTCSRNLIPRCGKRCFISTNRSWWNKA